MVKSGIVFTLASALALASAVSAQVLSYSQPIGATRWTTGKTATVSWTNTCKDLASSGKSTNLPITLNSQVGQYQVQVPNTGAIGYLDCSKAGSTTVEIPAGLPQDATYSILVVNGDSQSYSAQFSIDGGPPAAAVPAPGNVSGNNTASGTASPTAQNSTVPATTTTESTTAPTIDATVTIPTFSTPTTTTGATRPTITNNAGSLKAGSTVALVIVAAAGALLL
ncbi:hypothetical protein BGW38_008696 [Lunasporangiospora selenospora]|uniref:Ser-Thr-rich glycosyl-phosphatidyl-inositol-anchored membrane family-domain-containing protein n=1 Tax=Lunasporangiospora selenospora TaxID=979761 RepID=A0A9P6FYC5_9FUNG|nr:hypothetical protein BGW38_008696 [Lunasporangiospora selenospora]